MRQALSRYAAKNGLKTVIMQNESVRRVLHLLIGLALLPASKAEQGLKVTYDI